MSKEKQMQSELFLLKENGDIVPLARQSEWISVEDRLPDPTQNVLICKTFRDKPYIDIGCVKDAKTCYCASDEFIIKPWLHKLTHWMPLPEPPKMKGGAEQ